MTLVFENTRGGTNQTAGAYWAITAGPSQNGTTTRISFIPFKSFWSTGKINCPCWVRRRRNGVVVVKKPAGSHWVFSLVNKKIHLTRLWLATPLRPIPACQSSVEQSRHKHSVARLTELAGYNTWNRLSGSMCYEVNVLEAEELELN